MRRIFLAAALPKKERELLSEYQSAWPQLPARWTRKDNLHVTLLFLGNTRDEELAAMESAVKETAQRHAPFAFTLSEILYGPERHPRMIWAKGKTPEEMEKLVQDLKKALGREDGEDFRLHVTLARLREWEFLKLEPEERPDVQEDISLAIPVSSIDIMESRLKRTGSEYTLLKSVPL